MPLTGEYAPSPWDWSREQADKYAESGGTEATDMKGKPIILLTTVGANTGKLRKTPLMRVEHNGEYAVVASLGGAPKNPVWYYNIAKNPRVELQDGGVTRDYDAHEVFGDEKATWWARSRGLARLRRLSEKDRPPDSGVRADSGELSRFTRGKRPHGTIDRCPLN